MNISNLQSSAVATTQAQLKPMATPSEEQRESPAERMREAAKASPVAQSNLAAGQGQKVNVLA
ncbi:MAG: hypothetical protein HKM05_06200 [Spirochaetales bacterium]|nr:hypothetical protein [Spirochaetales bacterium]